MSWEAKQLQIQRKELFLPHLPHSFDGVRVLFITDLHRTVIPDEIRKSLDREELDIILIGGDITEKKVPLKQVEDNISFLCSLGPAYFVWGNNDYQGDYRSLEIMLRNLRVTILDNQAVSFEAGQPTERLWLIGVDDLSLERDRLDLAISDIDKEGYRILFSHEPLIVEQLKQEHQIRAVFSGHTHGGQICLPWFGPIIKIINRDLATYVAGEYELDEGEAKLFISRGVGTSGLPLRLLAPAELHILTLRREEK